MQTEEQILESIRTLPAAARERLLRTVRSENEKTILAYAPKEETAWRNERFRKAQLWIDAHKEEYDGEFVLLEGDILLGHGNDPRKLYKVARERRIRSPFVTRIRANELPFGGW